VIAVAASVHGVQAAKDEIAMAVTRREHSES
jgi:hypothetical protein